MQYTCSNKTLGFTGDASVDELMTRLIQDHEVFAEQQQEDIQQEVRGEGGYII